MTFALETVCNMCDYLFEIILIIIEYFRILSDYPFIVLNIFNLVS